MSKLTVFLEHHVSATNLLAGVLQTVLGTLPIQANEKAGLLQAIQEVRDVADGLHKGLTQSAEEIAAAALSGAMTEKAAAVATELQSAPHADGSPTVVAAPAGVVQPADPFAKFR